MTDIQYVSYNQKNIDFIKCTTFEDCITFDTFRINVIDLSNEEIWCNSETEDFNEVDISNELSKINKFINKSTKAKIVFILPQNKYFSLPFGGGNNLCDIEDELNSFLQQHFNIFSEKNIRVHFNPSIVRFESCDLRADFVIDNSLKDFLFIETKSTKQIASIMIDNRFIFTTINLPNYLVKSFCESIPDLTEKEYPEWCNSYFILNDEALFKRKEENDNKISNLKKDNETLESKISINRDIKSCLWKTGDELVKAVFPLLEEIYDVDLSNFVDKKEADFIFTKNEKTIVGEIKGVTTNVARGHVSKTEAHRQEYFDKLDQKKVIYNPDNIISVLIVNYELEKDPSKRDKINPEVINYAKREKVIIFDSVSLLKVLQRKRDGSNSNDEFESLIAALPEGYYKV